MPTCSAGFSRRLSQPSVHPRSAAGWSASQAFAQCCQPQPPWNGRGKVARLFHTGCYEPKISGYTGLAWLVIFTTSPCTTSSSATRTCIIVGNQVWMTFWEKFITGQQPPLPPLATRHCLGGLAGLAWACRGHRMNQSWDCTSVMHKKKSIQLSHCISTKRFQMWLIRTFHVVKRFHPDQSVHFSQEMLLWNQTWVGGSFWKLHCIQASQSNQTCILQTS